MRLLCAAICAAFLPMMAMAAEDQSKFWRSCSQDSDCILIDGTCDKTAVNIAFKAAAMAYYADLSKRAKCVERFWVPKDGVAQCKPKVAPEGKTSGGCEVVGKPPEKKS